LTFLSGAPHQIFHVCDQRELRQPAVPKLLLEHELDIDREIAGLGDVGRFAELYQHRVRAFVGSLLLRTRRLA
jgi:hypothetical protein